MYKLLSLPLLIVMLAGCATVSTNKLGISKEQWNQLDESQRDQIVENYRQIRGQQRSAESNSTGNSVLAVNIQGGKVLMPPFVDLKSYEPISFDIREGNCNQKLKVFQAENSKRKTFLKACYKDHMFYLDPSPYELSKVEGSIQFPYMPIWKRGFTYSDVSSSGYTRLTNVDISIREMPSS